MRLVITQPRDGIGRACPLNPNKALLQLHLITFQLHFVVTHDLVLQGLHLLLEHKLERVRGDLALKRPHGRA